MEINKKRHGLVNPKTGKVYSTVFKKRTVQFYLSGRYDEQAIWKIFKVNRTLLLEWRKWYYEHFESSYYTKPNYGKGKIPTGRKQNTPSSVSSISKSVTAGADEKSRTGNFTGNSRRRPQSEAKKKWKKAVEKLRIEFPQSSLKELCAVYGKSRQAWYRNDKQELDEERYADLIEKEVKRIRKALPRLGAKKLYAKMKPFLVKHNIKKGREKFKDVLRARNLMIQKKKRSRITTNSNHHYRKYPNIACGLKVEKANTLWVSDITYVPFGRSFFYLSLVMDAYSRKIVGWDLSESLKAEGAISALKMALSTLPRNHQGLMHHSDRGLQYCCNAYIKLLKKNKVEISMTEYGDPYENILAERINKTIKEEFLNEFIFLNFKEAKSVTAKSVRNYNQKRPHASLNYFTPEKAHGLSGGLRKIWKNNKTNNNNVSKKKRA